MGNFSDNCVYKQVWTIFRFGENIDKTKGRINCQQKNVCRLWAEEINDFSKATSQIGELSRRTARGTCIFWCRHKQRTVRYFETCELYTNINPYFHWMHQGFIQYLNKITRTRSPVRDGDIFWGVIPGKYSPPLWKKTAYTQSAR